MKNVRVIARLDIKGPNLVKGIHLEGLRVLGRPEDFADHYYQSGVDELIYMDAVASLYERASMLDLVRRTASRIFVPLCVGGGLRTVEDIYEVLRAGADKVSLNTAAIRNPEIVSEAAKRFGSSTIVVAIESIRQSGGGWRAYTENGREPTGRDVVEWAKEVVDRGAGELLVTSVDREGTGKGYDHELLHAIESAVNVPVIAHGGGGRASDVVDVVRETDVGAVAIASLFHYEALAQIRSNEDTGEGNRDFLKSGRRFTKIQPLSIPQLKTQLRDAGVPVRSAL